jgi:DNA polymerase
MKTLYLDLETYCETPIKHGVHRYAETVEILLFAYALDDGPVKVWDVTLGGEMPTDLCYAFLDESVQLCAHNAGFDRTVLEHCGYHSDRNRWYDTMVQAYAHSLPGALGDLCDILKVDSDQAKDKDGKQLVLLFCKPSNTRKIRRATRETHPEHWARFVDYASRDIEAMRVIKHKMPTWNYTGAELELWHLDQQINERGVMVDTDLATAAIRAVDRAQQKMAARVVEMTDGAVQSATQRAVLLKHILSAYGVELPDMQQSTLERRAQDLSLPLELRELLAIRVQAGGTSTSKYRVLINGASSDSRLRGTLQFNGATRTGRWAGRLFQPQNLPRPSLKQAEIDLGVAAMKSDCEDLVVDDVMQLTSSAIRGCLIAPAGKKLVVADLSNIEGRVLAWLAGETWKIKAFADFDLGTGHDLYKLAYAKSFGVHPKDVSKDQRQIGKVQELALGYEGGVGAFLTFAAAYGIDLEAMGEQAWGAIPADIKLETGRALGYAKKRDATYGLSDRAWQTCDAFKRSWRRAHPAVCDFWFELNQAAHLAIVNPGVTYPYRQMAVRCDGAWLRIKLPSGRCLCYPNPRLEGGSIEYRGINQYTRKWSWLKTYGGKLVENVTQAVSRDILAASMQGIEDAGYQIVLTVHDEIIAEAPDSPEFNAEHLASLMIAKPHWAEGLPLAAAGFEAYRYRKE